MLVAASQDADESLVSSFLEGCRAFFAYLGITDSKEQLELHRKEGAYNIAREMSGKQIQENKDKTGKIVSREIVLESLSFIEKTEKGKPFIYAVNDYGMVRLNRSMKLEELKEIADRVSSVILFFPEHTESSSSVDLEIPYSSLSVYWEKLRGYRPIG